MSIQFNHNKGATDVEGVVKVRGWRIVRARAAKGLAQGIGEQVSKCLCQGAEAGCQNYANLLSE